MAAAESEVQDELIVFAPRESASAARLKKTLKTATLTQVTAREITKQASSLSQVLKENATVDTAQSGGPGAASGIFLRGLPSQHAAIIIDGMPLRDAGTSSGAIDGSLISLQGIESLLVLKGPQGPRYGSNAMAGAILVETKKNSSDATVEFNSIPSLLLAVSQSKKANRGQYSISAETGSSAGISAARSSTGEAEKDPYTRYQLRANLQDEWSPQFETQAQVFFQKMETAIDDYGFNPIDRPGMQVTTQNFLGSVKATENWSLRDETSIRFQASRVDRTQNSPASRFTGTHWTLGLLHESRPIDSYTLQVGAEKSFETTEQASQSNVAVLTEHELRPFSPLTLELGARIEPDSTGQAPLTYRVGTKLELIAATLFWKSTVGTGFKRPSLFQLTASTIGNPALQSEKSLAWDTQLSWEFSRSGRFSLGVFFNDLTNLIDFDGTRFQNIAGAQTWGLEWDSKYPLSRDVRVGVSYLFLRTRNALTGAPLLRRATERLGLRVDVSSIRALDLWSAAQIVGSRTDLDGSGNTVILAPYWVWNVGGNWQVSRDWKVFTQVENLLGADYQEVAGYASLGTTLTTGFNYTF